MAIFTDKRELEIQPEYKQFTGRKNMFGKIGNVISKVPGFEIVGNEMQIAGSTGHLKKQYKSEGRKEALANTINTASTVSSFVVPGGPLAKMAMGMATDTASNAVRDVDTGKKINKKDAAVEAGVKATEEFEKSGSALVNDVMRKGGNAMAQADLDEAVADVDVDSLLMDEAPDVDFKDAVMSDNQKGILDEMGAEALADESMYTDGLGSAGDVAKGGGKGVLGIGKGGKLGAGINKFQSGKFAKGVGQAANVASIATSVGGLVQQGFASDKRMEESRKRARQEKVNNQYYSYA